MVGFAFAVAMALAAAQPSAASPTAAAASQTAPIKVALEANDPERIVCKTEVLVGSHFTSRLCGTNRDWDERRRADREAFENFVLRSYSLQPGR